MNIAGTQPTNNPLVERLRGIRLGRGAVFGIIIIVALCAFEVFNFSTTDYALKDVLGDLQFAGIGWSTILTLAFCGIDFAGIARLFTPEQGGSDATETWYLFGAWLLAATMNAILTWWGVSIAISNRAIQTNSVVSVDTLTTVVPIFVALMVWLIRILIIGSLSYAGERLFSQDTPRRHANVRSAPVRQMAHQPAHGQMASAPATHPVHPTPKPTALPEANFSHPEPTYQRLSTQPRSMATPRTEPGMSQSANPRR